MLEQRADHQDNKMIKISTTHLMWLADLSKLRIWALNFDISEQQVLKEQQQASSSVHTSKLQ